MEQYVKAAYPGAATGTEVTEKYLQFLADEYGADLSRILFATSLCCDDVNVSTDFRRVLTRPFTLGGLGGLPYAGFTGMVAYAHHIPDGGDAFIFYGPHIGITDDGELGRMRRPGQQHLTNSCGALMLALERLQRTKEVYVPVSSERDYQQVLLERAVMPYKQQIITAGNPKKEITEIAYNEINKNIRLLVDMAKAEFRCNRIFLLGGVIINTSPDYNDAVEIRNFDVINVGRSTEFPEEESHSILHTDAFRNL